MGIKKMVFGYFTSGSGTPSSLRISFTSSSPFPSWYLLVGFISSATVFTYIMGGVALRHFRKTVTALWVD